MSIAVHCRYRPGGAEDRLIIRDIHLEYMMSKEELISAGGAIVDSGKVVGMYLLLGIDDDQGVDDFLAAEPYTQAGLFISIERVHVHQMMPEPHPGFLDLLLEESRRVGEARRTIESGRQRLRS